MNIEEVRDYCLKKKGVTESFPFDVETLVFKVMGKMFALMSINARPLTVNLKMDHELVAAYRDRYVDVRPGYHMNKQMWNTVCFEGGTIPQRELLWMIDHSYEQVVHGLTKKLQKELKEL